MTRDQWLRLSPLIDLVLDTPFDQRRTIIADLSAGDESIAAALTRFMDADRQPDLLAAAERERIALLSDRLFDTTFDLIPRLQQSLGGTYTIEREIGGGGMSRVFIAVEHALARTVVIKVLPGELVGAIDADTLTREIRLTASLQQANIVPVLTAGTAAGFPYYTMPLVEGRSLRDRILRDGALPIGDAVGIMRDVARALAYAHGHGVMHRDIKPGNILLSDLTAVVTDFGIARALGAAREAAHPLSAHADTMGTPAYVAPEQAAGNPDIDHRADIYSFGCVAYEMLTGRPPFAGSSREIIAGHLETVPRTVTELRPDTPAFISRLVASCLAKLPSQRPQSPGAILASLESATIWRRVDGWGRLRWAGMAAAAAFIALTTLGVRYYRATSRDTRPLTLAAIPFINATRDTSLGYLADGLSDELLSGMSKVGGIQVVGRSTAFRYRRLLGPDLLPIQRALGVRLLITATMRESQGRIVVSAQLNDSVSGSAVWSDSFARDAAELGTVTDDMIRRITSSLRTRFGSRIVVSTREQPGPGTTIPAALDLYLIGQSQLRRRGEGIAHSIGSFQKAIDLDSGYARAHAALAMALNLDPFFNGTPAGDLTTRVIAEARRALALDSTLAEAHAALGTAHANSARWQESDDEMRHAIALDPDDAMIRQTFARQLIIRGRTDEALTQLERARAIEQTSPLISAWLSYAFFLAGRRDSAIIEADRTIELDPAGLATINLVSLVNLSLGRSEKVVPLVEIATGNGMTNAAYLYAKLGDTASANRVNRTMAGRNPQPWFIDVSRASVLLARGDSAGALSALERSASKSGSMWVFFIPLADPAFDLVRASPRFAGLLKRANLDPASIGKRVAAR